MRYSVVSPYGNIFVGVEFGVQLLGRVGLARVDGILGAVRGAGKIFFLFGMFFFCLLMRNTHAERVRVGSECVGVVGPPPTQYTPLFTGQ